MKVKGLDGKTYNLDLTGHVPLDSDTRPRSRYHKRARALLAEMFPLDRRLEEVVIPASNGLSIDILLPSRNLALEIQGEQHYRFVPFFHQDRLGYWKALRRDIEKRNWCELNEIRLVELPFNEDDDAWRKRILTY